MCVTVILADNVEILHFLGGIATFKKKYRVQRDESSLERHMELAHILIAALQIATNRIKEGLVYDAYREIYYKVALYNITPEMIKCMEEKGTDLLSRIIQLA